MINQDPDPADNGKYVDVRFKFDNNGSGIASDVEVEILPEYPFSLYSGTALRKIGTIQSRQKGDAGAIVKFRLRVDKNAIEGENEIKLRYRVDDQVWITPEEFFLDIEREEVIFAIGSLETEPEKLIADTDDAKLSVELQNIGDGKAENVVVQVKLPDGFEPSHGYSDRANLGIINGSNSKTAKFFVDIDEDVFGGEYDAELIIKYKEGNDDDNEYITEILDLKIPVKAAPLFEIIDIETVPKTIGEKDEVTLKLKIKNVGREEADSVSIRAFKEASQPFEFEEKSDFVGKLKFGEIGEAILKFTVEEGATPKKYLMDIEIRAVDSDQVLVFEKTIPVVVSDNTKSGFSGNKVTGILIVVIIIALGLFGYRYWKKKK